MANTLFFDEQFYLQQNPDVAAAVSRGIIASGAQHFEQFGRFEARNPNAYFNTSFYLGQYPDVARAGINPLTHFLNFGVNEARATNATELSAFDTDNNGFVNEFNAAAYLQANADVAAAVTAGQTTAYKHFIEFGQFEGRSATLTNGTVVSGPFLNNPAGNGSSFAFTTNIDALTGTSGNDTFTADAAVTGSVSAADSVNGGLGTDTLNIFNAGNGQVLPQISNVEVLTFTAPNGFTGANVSGIAGLNTVNVANAAAGFQFTVNANQDVGFINVTGAQAQTVITTATDTAVTINATNSALGAVDVQGAAITTLNVVNNGTGASTLTSLGSTTGVEKTINLSGSQAITITNAFDTSVTTVDASANRGGVNVTLGASDVSVTGGSGNDKFVFGSTLTTADTVVGGAGTDTVTVVGADYSTVVANGTLAAINTKVSGVEVIELTGTAATTVSGTTFTNTEVTKLLFNTTGANVDTINSAGSVRTYAFGEINSGAATLNGTAGVTSFNVSLEGTATNGANVTTLTSNFTNSGATQVGTGSINLLSTGANGTVNTLDLITGTSNGSGTALTSTAVTITGAHDLTLGTSGTGTGFSSAANVNASAFTGKLEIWGSTAQDTIVGGTGADTIHATAGGDIYTGGAGVDTFIFSNVNQATQNLTTITDFVSGTDKLSIADLSAGNGTFNATAVNVSGAADFASALNLAAAGDGSTNGAVSYFQQGGNTYVVVDNSASAAFVAGVDAVIKLTGVVNLAAADITA